MAKPASRDELKEYCLRTLGKPVIEINVDENQLQDRMDEALQMYSEYHYDATEKVYEKHKITAADITNEYITVPSPGWSTEDNAADQYIGITRIFDQKSSSSGMFDLQYQIRLNDLTTFGTMGGYELLSYQMKLNHLSLIEELLVGKIPVRFQKHMNRLHLDWNWATDAQVDEYIIIEAFKIINPETYTDVYNDMWLKKYITALFKEQWGQNLSKHSGVQILGGVTLNGREMMEDARGELQVLREEMSSKYELPPDFYMS